MVAMYQYTDSSASASPVAHEFPLPPPGVCAIMDSGLNYKDKENGMNGWQRLWELTKWLAAIAAAIWCVMSFTAAMPAPSDPLSPAASQIVIGIFLVAVIGGGITYGALHSLEWVYRGFRPKKPAE